MKSKMSGEDEMNKRLEKIKSLMGDPSLFFFFMYSDH